MFILRKLSSNLKSYAIKMELKYVIQKYDWGKRGVDSIVASLRASVDRAFTIEPHVPYAELWLGTHPNGPSTVTSLGEPLSVIIANNPDCLGQKVRERFGDQLPFLFKVLSVNQALSIQAHPNKKHAEKLHLKNPDIYKDSNHKPELAIALTQFEALCGFRPRKEISYFIQNIPELAHLIGKDIVDKYENMKTKAETEEWLKQAFRAVLSSSKADIQAQLKHILSRFKNLRQTDSDRQLAHLLARLSSQYPGDVGCFVMYFLNYIKLKPFEAIYLAANVPHAYLAGDCVECMACSDNVVRAGLTPKLIDVDTLCSMLIYKEQSVENVLFRPIQEDEFCSAFKPPVADFAVIQIKVPVKKNKYTTIPRDSASVILVISGHAKANKIVLQPGTALFLSARETIVITDTKEDLLVYQALANV